MSEIRTSIHQALLDALATILRPVVKLMLQSGVSYDEFNGVAKTIFVQVATEDYRRRGRPPNYSQVSAMTGISRREVSKIRDPDESRWTPNMETSPVNTLLHQWHFDADFSDGAGHARALPFDGDVSFSALVTRHVRDIPPGAMRSTLLKAGVATEGADGLITVTQPFLYKRRFDEDLIRGIGFTLANVGSTVLHNATLHQRTDIPLEQRAQMGRMERGVWSEHLSEQATVRFRAWVRQAAPRFLEEANHVIGESEFPKSQWADHPARAVGIGIYYFEED